MLLLCGLFLSFLARSTSAAADNNSTVAVKVAYTNKTLKVLIGKSVQLPCEPFKQVSGAKAPTWEVKLFDNENDDKYSRTRMYPGSNKDFLVRVVQRYFAGIYSCKTDTGTANYTQTYNITPVDCKEALESFCPNGECRLLKFEDSETEYVTCHCTGGSSQPAVITWDTYRYLAIIVHFGIGIAAAFVAVCWKAPRGPHIPLSDHVVPVRPRSHQELYPASYRNDLPCELDDEDEAPPESLKKCVREFLTDGEKKRQ